MGRSQDEVICYIVHWVPGRIRFRSSMPFEARQQEALGRRLSDREGFRAVRLRAASRSIVVRYDPGVEGTESVWAKVSDFLQGLSEGREVISDEAGAGSRRTSRTTAGLALHGVTAGGLTLLLLFSFWRRVVRHRPLADGPLGLIGAVTFVGALPLFLRAWREWIAGRHIGLFPFLGVSSLIALMAGAASTALNIVWTLSLGMFLEELAMEKARGDVRKMVETAPQTGQVLENDQTVEKRVVDMQVGDQAVVHTGWVVPADGVVVWGQASVDESKITGHQYPELRSEGQWVFGGTTVQEGSFRVEIKKPGRETYLNRVLDLVEEALDSRSEVERKADVLAGRMVRIGTLSTLGTLIVTRKLSSTLAVLLVMSCPCATILAASTALTASIASAARRNILIKSGAALEAMHSIDCLCFDKTGTLTQQLPELVEMRTRTPSISEERLLMLASSVEAFSQHPIARTVVQAARRRQVQQQEVIDTAVILGRGVRGYMGKDEILVGSGSFLKENGIDIAYFTKAATKHLNQGRTPVYVAKDGKAQGLLILEAAPHPESGEVLSWLKRDGLARLSLVSGDDLSVVQPLCLRLPFDECLGELRPDQKTEHIRRLQADGHSVCMVGDGVNDALALSTADLGLAIGAGGSDAALEAADIVLMGNDLNDIVVLRRLSHRSLRIIEQNFWIGAGSDYFGLGLAFMGLLTPLLGCFIHVGHTVAIMCNSSRLLGWSVEDSHR